MEKLKTSDFIALTKILSTSNDQSDYVSLSEALGKNIFDLYVTIAKNPTYSGLYELMKETKPILLTNTQHLPHIPDQKLVAMFVEWSLYLLEQYSLALTKEMRYHKVRSKSTTRGRPPPDELSDSDKKAVFNCIDFVIVFGILMHLSEGVGNEQQYPIVQEICRERRCNIKLLVTSLCLMIELHSLTLSSIFRDYINVAHFNTLFAGLFEIVYNPAFKRDDLKKNGEGEPFADNLMNLVHIMDPKFIFKQLLQLLKCSEITCAPQTRVPDWLSEACSNMICQCLLKNNGLEDYILTFNKSLENGVPDSNPNKVFTVDWRQCDYVCRTITHLPYTCIERSEFFSKISSQIVIILKLLYNPDENDETLVGCPTLVPVLVRLMAFIFEVYPQTFVQKILSIIASPLHLIAFPGIVRTSEAQYNGDVEVVDEQSLTICIEMLYELLVIFHFANSKLSTCLLPHVNILYTISVHLRDNNSYLRSSVEELICRIMDDLDVKEAVTIIKKIIGFKHLNVPDHLEADSAQKPTDFMKMDSSLSLNISTNGGLLVMRRGHHQDIEQNSLVVIDKKCKSIVEMLSKLRNKHIVVHIFMDCLMALTKEVNDELSESRMIRTVAVKELKVGSSDWTNNFAILTLLNALIHQCHEVTQANFDRLIIFCKAVIEMNMLLLENSVRCSFHEQLLNFAADVLNQLIDKAHKIKNSQWEQAFLILPNLQRLALSYPISAIRTNCVQALKQLKFRQTILMEKNTKNLEKYDARCFHSKRNEQNLSNMAIKSSETEDERARVKYIKKQEMRNKSDPYGKNVLIGFDAESQEGYQNAERGSIEVLLTREVEDVVEKKSSYTLESMNEIAKELGDLNEIKTENLKDFFDTYLDRVLSKNPNKQSPWESLESVKNDLEEEKVSYEDTLEGSKKMLRQLEMKLRKQQETKQKALEHITLQEIKLQKQKIKVLERSKTNERSSSQIHLVGKKSSYSKSVRWSDGDNLK